jgi:hypothetical protein
MRAEEKPPKTVGELLDRYIENRRPHIGHPYALEVAAKSLKPIFNDKTLDEICERNVLRTLCHDFNAHCSGNADNTVRKRLMMLQAALRWAWKRQWITGLPVMWIPDATEGRDRGLTKQDRTRLLAVANKFPTTPHIRTYIHLALQTSQHMRENLSMTWDQVNFDEGYIQLYGRNRRTVPITDELREVLERAHEARRTKHIIEFGGKPVRTVYPALKRLMKKAGLEHLNTIDLRLAGPEEETSSAETPEGPQVFVSYSADDGETHAEALVAALEREGQACWFAKNNQKAGLFGEQLTRAIKGAHSVVLILTPGAAASPYVFGELVVARKAEKNILIVRVDEADVGDQLATVISGNQRIEWTKPDRTARSVLKMLDA